jgi:G patch domain-containing protein 1
MVDEENEDYLYYGTPIEREEEMTTGHKRKMTLDVGQMRRLPPWKHEVFIFPFPFVFPKDVR